MSVIVEKITELYVSFAINEANVTSVFWSYLEDYFNENKTNKEETIREFQELIALL